jgi:O-antigen/teichoic acid export membrane protein
VTVGAGGRPIRSIRFGIKWTFFNVAAMVLSKVLRGAVIPKLLNPASYGLFTSVSIFTRYLQFSDVGATAYFTKMLPHAHFNEGPEAEARLTRSTFSLIVLSNLPVLLYLGLWAFLYSGEDAAFYRLALLLLIPITVISKLKEFFINYAWGIQRYREGALASAVSNYVSLVTVIGGVYLYGAAGGIVGLLMGETVACVYALLAAHVRPRFEFGRALWDGWQSKLRLFLVSISEALAATLDQIFILKVFDATGLGFYMLGLTFGWVLESLSDVFNTAFYPKLMAMVRSRRAAAEDFVHLTVFCYLLASFVTLPLLLWAIETVVSLYFSNYRDGLVVYHAMVFLGLARGTMSLMRRTYVALDKEKAYIVYTLITSGVYALVLAAAWSRGLSFNQVVAVILLANVTFLLFFYAMATSRRGGAFWKNIVLLLLILGVATSYQYGVRTTPEALWSVSMPSVFLATVLLAGCAWAYREREAIRHYLDGEDDQIPVTLPPPANLESVGV